MAELLIVKNISREGPGLLEDVLLDEKVSYEIVDLGSGATLPSLLNYKAIVVLGGPDSANDNTEKMINELAGVRTALEHDIPYLGICLGLQVAVKAVGGNVVKANNKEVGFLDPAGERYQLELTDLGKSDPLSIDLPDILSTFHLHGETVELTDSMQLLATGKHCQNQIVKLGSKAYGIQSHFELTAAMLKTWTEQDPDLAPLGELRLLAEFNELKSSYTHMGQKLLRNFLKIAALGRSFQLESVR